MRLLSAVIKPSKLDKVLEVIQESSGVVSLAISRIEGFEHISHLTENDLLEPMLYSKIELVVEDEQLKAVHSSIVECCHTGLSGDGRILVLPLESTFRVATKEYL